MKELRFTRRSREAEGDAVPRSLASSFVISIGLHALVIAALIYVPADSSKPRRPPGAISVNLVSLPGPGTGARAAGRRRRSAVPKPQAGRGPQAGAGEARRFRGPAGTGSETGAGGAQARGVPHPQGQGEKIAQGGDQGFPEDDRTRHRTDREEGE